MSKGRAMVGKRARAINVILHIGVEKTGTTSIQAFLGKNHARLREVGIAPLGEFIVAGFNNLALPLAAKEDPGDDIVAYRPARFDGFRERVRASLAELINNCASSGRATIVCSSEHLSSRLTTTSEVQALRLLFPAECSFKIVAYLRRQDELRLGAQAEGIKSGSASVSVPALDPLTSRQPYGIVYYDYEQLLLPWETVFGTQNIVIRPYERQQLAMGDVVADFLGVIGVAPESASSASSSEGLNERLSPESLWFLANVNPYIGRRAREVLVKLLPSVDLFEMGSLIPNKQLEEFARAFEGSNERVARRYLGREHLFENALPHQHREFGGCCSGEQMSGFFRFVGGLLERIVDDKSR